MEVIDSHTEGEPTRVIIAGGPDLGEGPMQDRLNLLRDELDHVRRTVISEPRGNDVLVGALLCPPQDRRCTTGVIFFNNTGYLGMCGHGAMGVMATLAYLDCAAPGEHLIETPVGIVSATLHEPNRVSITNVPSYRHLRQVRVDVPGLGPIHGDVAWGGNWFFLVDQAPFPLNVRYAQQLSEAARSVRQALSKFGICGKGGEEIDHIEFFGPPQSTDAASRNFVFCPGGAYDRSPCGTGTSAKLACLAADGKLQQGQRWTQESIVGSRFEATYQQVPDTDSNDNGSIIPTITGSAYICAKTTLVIQPGDPFGEGIHHISDT